MSVSGIARMNIAGMGDEDLSLVRGVVARAVAEDPDADPNGLLGALDEEISERQAAMRPVAEASP